MKHLFLVTSAINTRFGRWSTEERIMQTVRTLKSVRERVPDAAIYLLESSASAIDVDTTNTLLQNCDAVLNFSGDASVQQLYNSTDNWDIIKNMTELMVFNRALTMIEDNSFVKGIDRIHKLSGRYELNDFFNPSLYETTDKIVFARKEKTYIGEMGVEAMVQFYYISRLWSWAVKDQEFIKDFFAKALDEFKDAIENGNYLDIEHLLFKILPEDKILELPKIGVEGLVGYHAYFRKD